MYAEEWNKKCDAADHAHPSPTFQNAPLAAEVRMVLEGVAETPQKTLPYPRDNGASSSFSFLSTLTRDSL